MPPSASNGRFVCSVCGYQSLRWYGRCPECGEWNTLEEQAPVPRPKGSRRTGAPAQAVVLSSVQPQQVRRFSSGLTGLDRTLGGGFVPGSVLLLAGEPGIGKSTLLLSVADNVASSVGRSLYISGKNPWARLALGPTGSTLSHRTYILRLKGILTPSSRYAWTLSQGSWW